MDIDWSPHCSTLFASVCKDGRLELWDLEKQNMIDPFETITAKTDPNKPDFKFEPHPSKTMVKFCPGSPILVTGDVAGDVNVYRIHGIYF